MNIIQFFYDHLFEKAESKPVQKLRTDKNKFEKYLHRQFCTDTDVYSYGLHSKLYNISEAQLNYDQIKQVINTLKGNISEECFFIYCYCLQYHDKKSLLKFKNISNYIGSTFYGYSAIGACIIAKGVGAQIKRKFILCLMGYGFSPNECDIQLAELALYDSIPKYLKQTTILFLGQTDFLNGDIRKYIVGIWIEYFKRNYWALPI
jgi:hypothetical protein